MTRLNSKQLVVAILVILGIILTFFFLRGTKQSDPSLSAAKNNSQPTVVSQNDPPQIVSTKPDPLDKTIITADQIIEITFNRPLENVGEFKVKIEPKIEFKLELSGDRKSGRIIPAKPYELNSTYTISIGSDTKFDGVGNWGQDKSFQFRTIKYTGV